MARAKSYCSFLDHYRYFGIDRSSHIEVEMKVMRKKHEDVFLMPDGSVAPL